MAVEAGSLCKADLVTLMVGEFPELQGHMGRLYALSDGRPEPVAMAIEEAWQPRFADDEVATTPAGIALALADRLDTLVGCFGIGLVPKGGDPQGLRRAALGVLRTLVEHDLRLDLRELIAEAMETFHAAAIAIPERFGHWTKARGTKTKAKGAAEVVDELVAFLTRRFRSWEVSTGITSDVVDAVIEASPPVPVVMHRKVAALAALSGHSEFVEIMTTFKRVLNITREHDYPAPSLDDTTHPVERALFKATEAVEADIAQAAEALDFPTALDHTLTLRKPVADLFDEVMVISQDPKEKAVRVGLLIRVSKSFLAVADFSRISTR